MKRTKAVGLRIEASQRRTDKREWVMKRRQRTRHLIELGGLVHKAGLVELTDDNRAVIFGALVEVAARLRSDDREQALLIWQQRGKRAFDDAIPHENRRRSSLTEPRNNDHMACE